MKVVYLKGYDSKKEFNNISIVLTSINDKSFLQVFDYNQNELIKAPFTYIDYDFYEQAVIFHCPENY